MRSRARFVKFLRDLRASYWFLPTVLVIGAILLASLMVMLDRNVDKLPFDLPFTMTSLQPDGAQMLVSVIAQSAFGVAGVMFSLTIVAVSFASGNFGPRLIGNFMRNRGTQWSLGLLIAIFVYALLVLQDIRESTSETGAFVPHLSISLAVVLALLGVLTVIYFVHHIPETINVSNITADLGWELQRKIEALIDGNDGTRLIPGHPEHDAQHVLKLGTPGYLQTVNLTRLGQLADQHEIWLALPRMSGEFVTRDTPVIEIWSDGPLDELEDDLRACFATGTDRTQSGNILFVVDQLVEMIARALSPGINDPFTAINCMNWLRNALVTAANHEGGLQEQSHPRIRRKLLDFELLAETAIGKAKPYIVDDTLARQHFDALMQEMAWEIEDSEHTTILKSLARIRDD